MTRHVLIWSESHVVGGCDRYLVDLLAHLDRSAWRVTLAGIRNPAYDRWLARNGVDLPRHVARVATLPGSPLQRLRRGAPQPAPDASAAPGGGGPLALRAVVAGLRYRQLAVNVVRLRALLRTHRPDVVFINNGGYPGGESCRAIALAARAEGTPRVVHFVHNMAYPPPWPVAAERAFDRRVDAAVDVWATAAGRARDALADERGITRARVRVVHYGVPVPPAVAPLEPAVTGFTPGALNLAVVASLEPRKGHAVLVESLAALRAGGTQVRAALVGTGPARAAVAAQIAAAGLDDRVRLLGWRDDVPHLLAAADALVLPSVGNECLPYAILEAMAAGLPVVSTDVAGIPEQIVDGATGFVVAPGDAHALARRVEALAADPGAARAMGARGAARIAERFTPERMVAETTALWL